MSNRDLAHEVSELRAVVRELAEHVRVHLFAAEAEADYIYVAPEPSDHVGELVDRLAEWRFES